MFTSFKAQLSSFLLLQGFFSRRETRFMESKEFFCILNKISRNSEEFYMRKREKTTVADKYTSNKKSSHHIQFRHIDFKLVIPIPNHSYQIPIHDTKYKIFIIGRHASHFASKEIKFSTHGSIVNAHFRRYII